MSKLFDSSHLIILIIILGIIIIYQLKSQYDTNLQYQHVIADIRKLQHKIRAKSSTPLSDSPDSPHPPDSQLPLDVPSLPHPPPTSPTRMMVTMPLSKRLDPDLLPASPYYLDYPVENFQLVGYVSSKHHPDQMFRLMGRQYHPYKYEYYVVHPYNGIKIPIQVKNDWELNTDDTIEIPTHHGQFVVQLYDEDHPII